MNFLSSLQTLWNSLFKKPEAHAKLGRNEPCYCGSGRKYKHCHLNEDLKTQMQNYSDQKHTEINRNHEPNWDAALGPEGTVGQRGLNKAPDMVKKKSE